MSFLSYFLFLVLFAGGVVGSYFIPESNIPLYGKFVFVGAWGAVVWFIYFISCKRKFQEAEENYVESLNEAKQSAPKTEYIPVVPTVGDEETKADSPVPVKNPFESILPPGAMPAKAQIQMSPVSAS